MDVLSRVAQRLFADVLVAAGVSTRTVSLQPYEGGRITRPDRLVVYDFAASPETAQEIAVARQVGAQVAEELVAHIRSWGLPAVQAAGEPTPRIGDAVLTGYFESVDPSSMAKRFVLRFGSGAAELRTIVEAYVMTDKGLRRLGSRVVEPEGGKSRSGALPLALAVASGNPIGLVISGAATLEGETSGRATIEGAKRTAREVADKVEEVFRKQDWI
jgi:Domain of unknown function (DUF4410)